VIGALRRDEEEKDAVWGWKLLEGHDERIRGDEAFNLARTGRVKVDLVADESCCCQAS
jgi:hypothetical protein